MVNNILNKLIQFVAFALISMVPLAAHAIPKAGQPLPLFSVTTPSGQQVTNQNYSGRVLLLVFSTDYCTACKMAVPKIVKLTDRYGREDFHALGLFSGLGMENDELKKYMHTYGVSYPMAFLEERVAKEQFGMMSVPYSLLVDKNGDVAGVYYGYSEGILKKIEDQVKKLLAE